ncbi:MAG: potassium transporter [Gammaproteobacteria bacterium]|nr:potassium transporter [Gammaproteobacteria bacterium]
MINKKITVKLLALPGIWMGLVQLVFSMLSLFIFHDRITGKFFAPGITALVLGTGIFLILKKADISKVNFRDALIYATTTWLISGVLGALPILGVTHISFTDAVFESVSALTTTGATILSGLDEMPPTFLLYRQFLQWMGGLGIVIFVVAVLPMLNVGGMRLLRAETPGPLKDEKLSPRLVNTTHYLWGVYISITIACALAYYVAGMSAYDAIAHSFTTVSTGGFSTHDASMWYFESHEILWICNLFMILGAINFALHFRVFHKRSLGDYAHDEETKVFISIIVLLSIGLALFLLFKNTYTNIFESLSFATFHIISFITSTGYGAASFGDWPTATSFLLVFAGYLDGCAGSTAGGNKIIRNIITVKIININIKRTIHPQGVFLIKHQGKIVNADTQNAVMSFMFFAALSTTVITTMLTATGLDFWSSLTAVAACVNVLGPGFGAVGSNFQPVSDSGTWILSMAMILGRLEYLTVFTLFSPDFWRR